ncbi:MAG: hypothetical protein KAR42_16225 [candidate division Zixibacteria bacterium]|nr:hypothetical protein [candidate division Zixibacteria bacterium]
MSRDFEREKWVRDIAKKCIQNHKRCSRYDGSIAFYDRCEDQIVLAVDNLCYLEYKDVDMETYRRIDTCRIFTERYTELGPMDDGMVTYYFDLKQFDTNLPNFNLLFCCCESMRKAQNWRPDIEPGLHPYEGGLLKIVMNEIARRIGYGSIKMEES